MTHEWKDQLDLEHDVVDPAQKEGRHEMIHEWKVGDRFNRTITVSTDYEITRIDEKFVYLSDGKNIVLYGHSFTWTM